MNGAGDRLAVAALLALSVALWAPRLGGPLDLRYDAGVYYVLGTALAEGKGYRLLNEPGEIHAIQYPPLLAAFAAAHQAVAGTSDPRAAGHALRLSYFALFLGYIVAVYAMSRTYVGRPPALLIALITLLHVHTTFLSDLFFAEMPFALATVLAVLASRRGSGSSSWLTGGLAVAAYLLRTVGITLLAAWVGDAVLRRRFRAAAVRVAVALVPIVAWQGYIGHVKGGPEYERPAYPYQRAGYQYYNVGYLENLLYLDPFVPEKGTASGGLLAARIGTNLLSLPAGIGEAVSSRMEWSRSQLRDVNRRSPLLDVPLWTVHVPMLLLGFLIAGGLALLAARGDYLVPLYAAGTIAVVSLTPWPGQFERYLSPLTPLLALGLVAALGAVRARAGRPGSGALRHAGTALVALVVAGVLGQESFALYKVYTKQHRTVLDTRPGQETRAYELFFYPESWRLHDKALDWLGGRLAPGDVVATSTPHWLYLKSGVKSVMPPFEPDPGTAQRLLDTVPVSYLIVDGLEFVDVTRRYAGPVVEAFPHRWELVHSSGPGGSRVYRRASEAASGAYSDARPPSPESPSRPAPASRTGRAPG